MKRLLAIIPILLLLTACPKDKNARDTAAALKGAIDAAQAQYLTSCQSNPSPTQCQSINRAVAAQNLLITAIENYCGWPQETVLVPTAKCTAVPSAAAFLQTAVANANQAITEVKAILHP